MSIKPGNWARVVLPYASALLLLTVFVTFQWLSGRFLTLGNISNILVQASSVAMVAVGMTIVLLTGGIDLSVGAIMFVAAAIAGKLAMGDLIPGLGAVPMGIAVAVIITIGLAFGLINAVLIAYCRMMPFVVTLATLFIGRGLALQITKTRALNLPEGFLKLGQSSVLGMPLPVVLLAVVTVVAHVLLTQTPFGRQLYAMGNNREAARKAGINTVALTASVYLISGFCAALAGVVSVSRLGAVSPNFGDQQEFAAIAAAVLGGTSLFGGRGSVFPGTLLGAVLIQSIDSGLVMVNADPYIYPIITGATVFVAVLMDRLRYLSRQRSPGSLWQVPS